MARKSVEIPPKRMPAEVRLRNLTLAYEQLRGVYERQRRWLWMAVHAAGGRIEIEPDVYNATMSAPGTDTLVATERDTTKNRLVLVFVNEKGERLPESDKKLIIS